jgi:photosystem II stability/assembly factor-like uncharacterized protein
MKYFFTIVLLLIEISCSSKKDKVQSPSMINPQFTEFPMYCSIRALEVIHENTVWFAGNKGIYGYTKDGGAKWVLDSISMDGKLPEFRAIAITSSAIFLLNVASPAYLLKSIDEGKKWEIVYREDHPDVFYDCMKFWDDENGIAMGDPIDGCLSVLITQDGGNSWRKLDCSELPETAEGEAAFAASNTNISLFGNHAWIASGGAKARIYHSPDRGQSWEVFDTPMKQGGKMTGIFTLDFYDEKNGIIFGGNWEDQSSNKGNKAITSDGGKTWVLLTDGSGPGYRSCIQYIPNTKGKGIIAVGIPGISYSADGGETWQEIDQTFFYTIRLAPSGKVAWLAGKNKIARMEFGNMALVTSQ